MCPTGFHSWNLLWGGCNLVRIPPHASQHQEDSQKIEQASLCVQLHSTFDQGIISNVYFCQIPAHLLGSSSSGWSTHLKNYAHQIGSFPQIKNKNNNIFESTTSWKYTSNFRDFYRPQILPYICIKFDPSNWISPRELLDIGYSKYWALQLDIQNMDPYNIEHYPYWGFPKMVGFPNKPMGFPTKMNILRCFGGTTIWGSRFHGIQFFPQPSGSLRWSSAVVCRTAKSFEQAASKESVMVNYGKLGNWIIIINTITWIYYI